MSDDFLFPVFRLTSHGGFDEHCVELVACDSDELRAQAKDWRRWISRWRAATYAHSALLATKASSGFALEKSAGAAEAGAPGRLLYRMLRSGEPDIVRAIDRGTAAGQWLLSVDDPDGLIKDVLTDPLWRLLDPTPISDDELDRIEEANKARRQWPLDLPPVTSGLWHTRSSRLQNYARWHDPREGVRNQRWVGLVIVLIELRRGLNSGDLPRYYQALHTALEFSCFPDDSPQFRLAQPYVINKVKVHFTVHDHLQYNFGRLYTEMRDAAWERYADELGDGMAFSPDIDAKTHSAFMFFIDFKDEPAAAAKLTDSPSRQLSDTSPL
jgi:hypothetical protein